MMSRMHTAVHDMGSLGHMLQVDLLRDRTGLAPDQDVWKGVVSRCWYCEVVVSGSWQAGSRPPSLLSQATRRSFTAATSEVPRPAW